MYKLMTSCTFDILWGKSHKKNCLSLWSKSIRLHIIYRLWLMCMLHIHTFLICILHTERLLMSNKNPSHMTNIESSYTECSKVWGLNIIDMCCHWFVSRNLPHNLRNKSKSCTYCSYFRNGNICCQKRSKSSDRCISDSKSYFHSWCMGKDKTDTFRQLLHTSEPCSRNRIHLHCMKCIRMNKLCKCKMWVDWHKNPRYIVNSWKLCFHSTNSYWCTLNIGLSLHCQQSILACIRYKLNCCCISNNCSLKLLSIIDKVCMCLWSYQESTRLNMIRKYLLSCRHCNLSGISSIFHIALRCLVHIQVHKSCINCEDYTWNNLPWYCTKNKVL